MSCAQNLTGTRYEGNANWQWGNRLRLPIYGQPPLHQWSKGSTGFAQASYGIDPGVTGSAVSNFEQNFMMLALGRARELGYPADALASYLAVNLIAQLTDPAYNPFLIANGRQPTMRSSDGDFFPGWAEVASGYTEDWRTRSTLPLSDPEHGYDFIGLAAASMAALEPAGCPAWMFMQANALGAAVLDDNPKWAILPRAADGSACGATQLAHLKRLAPNPVHRASEPQGRPAPAFSQHAFRNR